MDEANPSPVVGTADVTAPASNENVPSAVSLKEIIKAETGREYATDEDALKGIKETYKAVTQRHEPPKVTMTQNQDVSDVQLLRHELQVSNWYQDHPEYKEVKSIISKFGTDPEKVVSDPEFKKVYDSLKIASETQSKSVLSSNARLASPRPDDYAQDLERLREDPAFTAEFMAKHKGIPMPTM